MQAAMLASIQGTDRGTMDMVTNDPVARQREPHLCVPEGASHFGAGLPSAIVLFLGLSD